ncbi:inositol monophosphatase family protein [Nocardia salmonicida]|uniref:inositol monophosphatase family protein n=1 Tax=Nocardia salmonicida TaxID=53431 RepID=UPI0036BB253F
MERALSVAGSNRVGLVDPLDGTANFIAGSPHYAVMAALVRPVGAPPRPTALLRR